MNCKAFEKCLGQYESGGLNSGEYYRASQHLRECPRCAALIRPLESSRNCPALDIDLSEDVLRRTSGESCRTAAAQLCDFVDGNLDQSQAELISVHLQYCSRCAKLAQTLSAMTHLLPEMAELAPAPSLVPGVLAATRPLSEKPADLLARAGQFLTDLLRRPRFSWEAAYLGTLLIFALFGTPFSPLPEAGNRMLATLQQQDGLVPIAGEHLAGFQRSIELGWTGIQKSTDRLTSLQERSSHSIDSWLKSGQDRVEQARSRLSAMRETSRQALNNVSARVKRKK